MTELKEKIATIKGTIGRLVSPNYTIKFENNVYNNEITINVYPEDCLLVVEDYLIFNTGIFDSKMEYTEAELTHLWERSSRIKVFHKPYSVERWTKLLWFDRFFWHFGSPMDFSAKWRTSNKSIKTKA